MPEVKADPAGINALQHLGEERFNQRRSRVPRDVEPGHGIAVALRPVAAAFSPLHKGKKPTPRLRSHDRF